MLRNQINHGNFVGFIDSDILSIAGSFNFVAWFMLGRGEGRVTHDLARWQPLFFGSTLWVVDVADAIVDGVSNDMYEVVSFVIYNPLIYLIKKI